MANQPKTANTTAGVKKGGVSGRTIGTALLLIPVIAVLMPSCILLGIGMAPTVVAYITDRTQEKYLSITVGLLNLCGTLPGIMQLWTRGQTYEAAISIATNPVTMLIAYGAAASGCAIYLMLPPILAHYYAMTTDTRLNALRRRQQALVEEWGSEVGGGSPPGAA